MTNQKHASIYCPSCGEQIEVIAVVNTAPVVSIVNTAPVSLLHVLAKLSGRAQRALDIIIKFKLERRRATALAIAKAMGYEGASYVRIQIGRLVAAGLIENEGDEFAAAWVPTELALSAPSTPQTGTQK